jgi:hypothetical protein
MRLDAGPLPPLGISVEVGRRPGAVVVKGQPTAH